MTLMLRLLGSWRQGWSRYLDRRNVDKGRGEEDNGGQCVVEVIAKRHELRV